MVTLIPILLDFMTLRAALKLDRCKTKDLSEVGLALL